MKVLVTGATGFVGGWLTTRLVELDHQVRVLVRENSDRSSLSDLPVEYAQGDITNFDSLVSALNGIDCVFHLAGLVGYDVSMRPAMNRINVFGTRNVLNACIQCGIRDLLYMSSVVAIGANTKPTPLTEDSPYDLEHLDMGYFQTKHEAEKLVLEAVKKGHIDAKIVNPSTIYGPSDAKKSSRSTQLKVAQGRFPFYTSGGVNVIAIEDLIDGIVAAWQKGKPGQRYILAGDNILIRELFEIISEEAGVLPPCIYVPNPVILLVGWFGEVLKKFGKKGPISLENARTAIMYHWFDSSRAQKELGLKTRPARDAIKQSVRWMKDNGLLEKSQ